MNAPAAWKLNYTGSGIGIALIDSGVNAHPDLDTTALLLPISRVVYSQSFVPGDSSPGDKYGHGTHIAGLIAGSGLSSTGPLFSQTFKGIAPGAHIINLRVLDENGAATDSLVIAAIDQAISLKSKYNIRIINLSLGAPVLQSYHDDPVCAAVERASRAGILVAPKPEALATGIQHLIANPAARETLGGTRPHPNPPRRGVRAVA